MSRRLEIMTSAAKVFASEGYQNSTMDSIAVAAGMAKGGLYYHFKSKEELFIKIIESGIDEIIFELNSILSKYDESKVILTKVLDFLLSYYVEYPILCSLFFGHNTSGMKRDTIKRMEVSKQRLVGAIAGMLERGNKDDSVYKMDYEVAAHIIISMLNGIGEIQIDDYREEQLLRSRNTMLQILFNGIMK